MKKIPTLFVRTLQDMTPRKMQSKHGTGGMTHEEGAKASSFFIKIFHRGGLMAFYNKSESKERR